MDSRQPDMCTVLHLYLCTFILMNKLDITEKRKMRRPLLYQNITEITSGKIQILCDRTTHGISGWNGGFIVGMVLCII